MNWSLRGIADPQAPSSEAQAQIEQLDKLPEFSSNLSNISKRDLRGWTEAEYDSYIGGVYVRIDDPAQAKALFGGERLALQAQSKLRSLGVESDLVYPSTYDLICDGENLGPTRDRFFHLKFNPNDLVGKDIR